MIRGEDPRRRREDVWPSTERAGARAGSDSSMNKKKEQTRKLRTSQGDNERKHASEGLRSRKLSLWGP